MAATGAWQPGLASLSRTTVWEYCSALRLLIFYHSHGDLERRYAGKPDNKLCMHSLLHKSNRGLSLQPGERWGDTYRIIGDADSDRSSAPYFNDTVFRQVS